MLLSREPREGGWKEGVGFGLSRLHHKQHPESEAGDDEGCPEECGGGRGLIGRLRDRLIRRRLRKDGRRGGRQTRSEAARH
jgi:hypothetical protein